MQAGLVIGRKSRSMAGRQPASRVARHAGEQEGRHASNPSQAVCQTRQVGREPARALSDQDIILYYTISYHIISYYTTLYYIIILYTFYSTSNLQAILEVLLPRTESGAAPERAGAAPRGRRPGRRAPECADRPSEPKQQALSLSLYIYIYIYIYIYYY